MNSLVILLCVIKLINSTPDSDSEEKYIDLLPEKEKEEFLEKIARRILSKVKTKDSPAQSSVEVSEDQLDTHDEFVQKIFNEETESLLNSRRNNSKENDKSENNMARINDTVLKNESKDSADTINEVAVGKNESLEEYKIPNNRDASKQYIDLTLRTGKRRKRENDSDERHEDVTEKIQKTNEPGESVPVKVFYEDIDKSKEKNEPSEQYTSNDRLLDDTSPIVHEMTTKYINNKRSTVTTEIFDNKFEETSTDNNNMNELSSFKNTDVTRDMIYTTFVNVDEPTTFSSESTTAKYDTKLTTTLPEIVEDNTEFISDISYVSTNHNQNISLENKSPTDIVIETTPEVDKTMTENDKKEYLITDIVEDNFAAEVVTEFDTKIASRKRLDLEAASVNNTNISIKTQTTTEIKSMNNENNTTVTIAEKVVDSSEELQSKKNYETMTKSTSFIIPLTQITTPVSENVTPKVKNSNEMDIKNSKSILREGYDREENIKERESADDFKNVKQYLVYEISKGQEPFIPQQSKINTELQQEVQPQFIPVYNYAPSYAYYSAYNRLGPNDRDQNQNNNEYFLKQDNDKYTVTPDFDADYYFDIGDRRTEDNNRKFRFFTKKKTKRKKAARKPTQNLNLPVIFRIPKDTKVYYNPKDYLDLDYYYRGLGNSALRDNRQKSDESANDSDYENSIFPNSADDHPFNSMKEGKIKNHLSAIRKILYNKNHFGYIDSLKSKIKLSENDNSTGNDHTHRLRSKDNDHHIFIKSKSKTAIKDSVYKIDDIAAYIISKMNDDVQYKAYGLGKQHFRSLYANEENSDEKPKDNIPHDVDGDFDHHEVTTPTYFINPTVTIPKNLTKHNQIKILLDMSDASDLLNVYDKVIKIKRTKNDDLKELDHYVNVLRDMITGDNEALEYYDWLGTTVDIEGALKKIYDLTELVENNEGIDPIDNQLLKYVIHLYKLSKANVHNVKLAQIFAMSPTKMHSDKIRKMLLPKNKNRKGKIKNPLGLLKDIYAFLRKIKHKVTLKDTIQKNSLEEFKEFLDEWRRRFYDLHEAVLAITTITKYNDQKWHRNLKQLYLKSPKRKHLLEVLLHLFSSRLLELIEVTFQNITDDKLDVNLNMDKKEVKRTKEEFAFILKVIGELKDIDQ